MLGAIAYHLQPKDRLSLATTNKTIYASVWGPAATPDIIRRFPLERRTDFKLTIHLDAALKSTRQQTTFRTVPARSRQQHVNVAINPTGSLAAILPYDNILRLICPRRCQIVSETPLPVFSNDVWDIARGQRSPQTRPAAIVYADDAGLDIETSLDFSPDGHCLMIASRQAVQLFTVAYPTQGHILTPSTRLPLSAALRALALTDEGTGGAAALSADGLRLAWVVFEGVPATVYVTVWKRASKTADWAHEHTFNVDRVWTRRWTALAWARPLFTPNCQHLVLIVNCAHKETRVVNTQGEFRRTKLCRFELMRVDLQNAGRIVRRTEWLDLAPEVYPRLLADALVRVLHDVPVHACGGRFGSGDATLVPAREIMRLPGLAFNSVHSCPAEATYKGLSFGQARHPWFVSKQPMFSFHFAPDGSRVVLATSPHCNVVRTLAGGDGHPFAEEEVLSERRKTVFKMMPWRAAFAAITAFSTSGQWLVGAALLDDDCCCVCVRNVTLREYFGEHTGE